MSEQRSRGDQPPDYPFTTVQNWWIAVVCVAGALLIVLPKELDFGPLGTPLRVLGVLVEVGLVTVVLGIVFRRGFTVPGVPRRGSGGRFRVVPFLVFCAFVGASLTLVLRDVW